MELMQPTPTRPSSRASRSHRMEDSERSLSPTKSMESPFPRPHSRQSGDSRPRGPRSPSPLPMSQPRMLGHAMTLPSMDDDLAAELQHTTPLHRAATEPTVSDATPTIPRGIPRTVLGSSNTNVPSSGIEPLSIKKKTSTRSSNLTTPTSQRRSVTRQSPGGRTPKPISPRRGSPQVVGRRETTAINPSMPTSERLLTLAKTTKEDVCDGLRFKDVILTIVTARVRMSGAEAYARGTKLNGHVRSR